MKHFGLLFFYFFIVSNLWAQSISTDRIILLRSGFEKQNQLEGKNSASYIIYGENNDTMAIVFNYSKAFVVISTNKNFPPIKAYSLNHTINIANAFDKSNPVSFYNLLRDDYIQFAKNKAQNRDFVTINNTDWNRLTQVVRNTKASKSQIGPLLPSLYGQVNCKDQNNHTINVSNLYTPHNYAPGCVAITFAEVLQYYKWPRIGVGSHSYSDNYGSSRGDYSFNYGSKYFAWGNILDKYYKVSSSSVQRLALGYLVYGCAVAVNMDFESNGSTSNVNRIPSAANKYFRYTAKYISKSTPTFWADVDSNIINKRPVQFPIYTSSGAGHAIVCDGLKNIGQSTQYYHLNMGWWGSSNGWYSIQGNFNAGGYSNITGAVINMVPVPELAKPKLKLEDNALDIEWFYPNPSIIKPQAYELQVKEGSKNWVTIADDITSTHYKYPYQSTELHRFRVRAKIDGKWNDKGWSNYEFINIKQAIANYYPEGLKVYPTIIFDKLTLEYKYLSGSVVVIYNTRGNQVFCQKMDNDGISKVKINIQGLASGTYILQIVSAKEVVTSKIIKLRKLQ